MKKLFCIVPRGHGEALSAAASAAGAPGATILPARGTANSSILQLLGLGDTSKDLVYSIVPEETVPTVVAAVRGYAAAQKPNFGILCSVPVLAFLRSGAEPKPLSEESTMQNPTGYRMINAILNKGYADDAMAAARTAGATGGTILSARGTAKEDDAKFFGVPLVPEKEQLVILVPADKAEAVAQAIRALPCFSEKGSGILYALPVSDFIPLGSSDPK